MKLPIKSVDMKILVIGSGMYVTGRENTGVGVLLSSILGWAKKGSQKIQLHIISKSTSSKEGVNAALFRISKSLGVEGCAQFHTMPSKADFDSFLAREKFDAAFVATPDHTHYEYLISLAKYSVNFFTVKPVVETYREHCEIMDLALANKLVTHVDFHKRFDRQNQIVRGIFRDKRCGNIVSTSVVYSQKQSIPLTVFKGWAAQSNPAQYLGVHYVDQFYFWSGMIPLRCMALPRFGYLQSKGINTPDSVFVVIEWFDKNTAAKAILSLDCSWVDSVKSNALSEQRAVITFDNGRIELDQKNRGLIVTDEIQHESVNPYFGVLVEAGKAHDFLGYGYDSVASFLDRVVSGEVDQVKLEDGANFYPTIQSTLIATKVVEGINKSIASQSEWVNL